MDYYNQFAVLTGDLVGSTKLSTGNFHALLEALKEAFDLVNTTYSSTTKIPYRIFRGDSFQAVIDEPILALKAAIMIRAYLRSNQIEDKSNLDWDSRVAIGIGSIEYLPQNISEGDGEAFRRSGPSLDEMKNEQRITVNTPWDDFNDEMIASMALLDVVVAKWTPLQADTILGLLRGKNQKTIARENSISSTAVHYRTKGAGWRAIDKLLARFDKVVNQKLNKQSSTHVS